MKSKIFLIVLALGWSALGIGTATAEDPGPEMLLMKPQVFFAPTGFDNNDQAQVVLAGVLPNTCYKSATVEVTRDDDAKVFTLKNYVYKYPNAMCLQVLTPYTQVVNLGVMNAGTYRFMVELKGERIEALGQMTIQVSSNIGPDDFLYAPVREAFVENLYQPGVQPTLVLRGTFTNSCMKLKEVRVMYTAANMLEVLPIATVSGTNCKEELKAFEHRTKLRRFANGFSLVHVRSLNGQAINTVVQF